MTFEKNMGSADKLVRLVIGALLIVLALTGVIGWWGWIGLIPLGTAFLNFCPLYALIGVRTCPRA